MGMSYRTQASTTPDLYLVGKHTPDVQFSILLTGAVVVLVVVIAAPGVVLWDVHSQGQEASRGCQVSVASCLQWCD